MEMRKKEGSLARKGQHESTPEENLLICVLDTHTYHKVQVRAALHQVEEIVPEVQAKMEGVHISVILRDVAAYCKPWLGLAIEIISGVFVYLFRRDRNTK